LVSGYADVFFYFPLALSLPRLKGALYFLLLKFSYLHILLLSLLSRTRMRSFGGRSIGSTGRHRVQAQHFRCVARWRHFRSARRLHPEIGDGRRSAAALGASLVGGVQSRWGGVGGEQKSGV